MEELPEKNTPPSQPEDQESRAQEPSAEGQVDRSPEEPVQPTDETPSASGAGSTTSRTETSSSQEGETPSADTATEALGMTVDTTSEPAEEAGVPEPQPVPSAQPEHGDSEVALQAEGAPAESPEVAAQPVTGPATETGTPPAAQTAASAASEEEAAPAADNVEVTASGALKVPGVEVQPSEEARPKRAPARPEKPSGPSIAGLRPGQVVEGTVTRIEKYGAFVNLGLVERRDGLIHISELAPGRIRRVEDVVQVGAPVRARVVSVDLGRGRVALSLNDVDEGISREASAGPSEPAMTAMAAAFQEAQSRRREQERSAANSGKVGDKKRREQEELMRRLRGEG